MAFVNDPLFLVVAEVTLSYIRRERGGMAGSKIIYPVRNDYAEYLFIVFYPSLFPIPRSKKGSRRAERFHFNEILIRR